jgi:hypothetical protein
MEAGELRERFNHDITLHPPQDDEVEERMDAMRQAAREYGNVLIDVGVVPSREMSTALTKVEESLFHGIASIARNQ